MSITLTETGAWISSSGSTNILGVGNIQYRIVTDSTDVLSIYGLSTPSFSSNLVRLALYDNSGTLLGTGSDAGFAWHLNFTTLPAGTYKLIVYTVNAAVASTFSLNLLGAISDLTELPPARNIPAVTAKGSWSPSVGRTTQAGVATSYSLVVGVGSEMSITLSSSADTYLYVIEPNGTEHTNDNISSTNKNSEITLYFQTGTYKIIVTTYLVGVTADYTLVVFPTVANSVVSLTKDSFTTATPPVVSAPTSTTLTLNGSWTLAGSNTKEDTANPRYSFQVDTTGSVTIDLSSADIDTFLYVMDSTGTTVLYYNDDKDSTTRASQVVATLAAGTYILVAAQSKAGAKKLGNFTIKVTGIVSSLYLLSGSVVWSGLAAEDPAIILMLEGYIDKSSIKHTVTKTGSTSEGTGKFNEAAMSFTGIGNISVVDNNFIIPVNTDMTFEFWVKPDSLKSINYLLMTPSGYIYCDNTGKLMFAWDTTRISPVAGLGTLTIGAWTHIAIVQYNGKLYFYTNGVSKLTANTVPTTGFCSGNSLTGTGTILMGNYPVQTGRSFNGTIAQVRFTKGLARYTANFTVPTATFTGTNVTVITKTPVDTTTTTPTTVPSGGSIVNGVYVPPPGSWTSDQESFTVSATYNGVRYSAIYSIAKSKAGANGVDGVSGTAGSAGTPGASGVSNHTVTVYCQQDSTPHTPTGGTYNFTSGAIVPPTSDNVPGGWSEIIPAASTTPTWASSYIFSTTTPNVTVSGGTWTSPVTLVVSGQNGATAVRAFRLGSAMPMTEPPKPLNSYPLLPDVPTTPSMNIWYKGGMTVTHGQVQWQCDGIYDGSTTVWTEPYLTAFKVDTLSAFTVNTGALNVTDVIDLDVDGVIKSGKTSFTDSTAGFWLDSVSGGRFSFGGATQKIAWDGTNLIVGGGIVGTDGLELNAATEITSYTNSATLTLPANSGSAASTTEIRATTLAPGVNSATRHIVTVLVGLEHFSSNDGYFALKLGNQTITNDVNQKMLDGSNLSQYPFTFIVDTAATTSATVDLGVLNLTLLNGNSSMYWNSTAPDVTISTVILTGKR